MQVIDRLPLFVNMKDFHLLYVCRQPFQAALPLPIIK